MNCSDREGPTEDPDSKGKLTNRRENDCAGLSASFVRDSFPEMAKRSSIFTVSSSGFLYLYKNRTLTFSSLLLSNFPFFHFLLRLPLHFLSLVFLLVFFVRFLWFSTPNRLLEMLVSLFFFSSIFGRRFRFSKACLNLDLFVFLFFFPFSSLRIFYSPFGFLWQIFVSLFFFFPLFFEI